MGQNVPAQLNADAASNALGVGSEVPRELRQIGPSAGPKYRLSGGRFGPILRTKYQPFPPPISGRGLSFAKGGLGASTVPAPKFLVGVGL